MQRDRDPMDFVLDDLLQRWFKWQQGYEYGRGYASSDATCRGYSTPTHWDWQNGAEDERAEEQQMRGVDKAIGKVPNDPYPWNTCLHFEARNLASQAQVWSSMRLPAGAELDVLRQEARNMLATQLRLAGLFG